jgi:hypothetical protein
MRISKCEDKIINNDSIIVMFKLQCELLFYKNMLLFFFFHFIYYKNI